MKTISPRSRRRLSLVALEDRTTPAVSLLSAASIGETGQEWPYDLVLDAAGNTLVTGFFQSRDADGTDFDPGPGVYNLQESGQEMAFVAKYAADGSLFWAWGTDASGNENSAVGQTLTTDAAGNVFVSGYVRGTVDFDPSIAHVGSTDVVTAPPDSFVKFLAKLNASGGFEWVTSQSGGTGPTDVAVDGAGNIYRTEDAYGLSKFNSSGQTVWTRALPAQAIALSDPTSANPGLYLTGGFNGRFDLNPGPGNFFAGTANRYTAHVTKLDSNGNFVWAAPFESADRGGPNVGTGIAVDPSGNVVATGTAYSRVDFDPGKATYYLSRNATSTGFVVKLTAAGQLLWAKNMAGHPDDVAIDASGNIYLTGEFGQATNPFDFDPGPGTYIMTPTNTGAGEPDAYVEKLDSNGNFVWAVQLSNARGKGIAVDAAGIVYSTGFHTGTADFDPGAGVYDLTAPGNTQNFYIWRLSQT